MIFHLNGLITLILPQMFPQHHLYFKTLAENCVIIMQDALLNNMSEITKVGKDRRYYDLAL